MEIERTIGDFVVKDDAENVRCRLLAGDNPNEVYPGGWSLLQAAVINQNVEMVQLLLSHGAEVNFLDKSHQTALHYAASFGYTSVMQVLLENGALLNVQNSDMSYAVSKIPLFICGGRTPLMLAVINGHEEAVTALLARGASATLRDADGRTAFELACRKKGTPMAHLFPEFDAMKDHFNPEPIDILKNIKARIDAKDEAKLLQFKQAIADRYVRKFPEVYIFNENILDPDLLKTLASPTADAVVGMTTHLGENVFKFKLFTPEFCEKLLEELAHFENVAKNELQLTLNRPNSMNNYGLILDEIGFYPFIEELIRTFVAPFCKIYFPNEKPYQFDAHHSFIVRYKVGEDIDLAKHVDDSEVTVNVCLGKVFDGGDLIFYGEKDDARMLYSHEPGTAVMHLGKNWHEADKIECGERSNLIIWCKCANRRYIKPKKSPFEVMPYVCCVNPSTCGENESK